jgi:hypothetical protein
MRQVLGHPEELAEAVFYPTFRTFLCE